MVGQGEWESQRIYMWANLFGAAANTHQLHTALDVTCINAAHITLCNFSRSSRDRE
jgi:hypothetical protein